MFLPFLPLILASAGLTLFSRELERTEPWLNLPLAVNLSLIILFSFLLAQMPQWLRQFSKFKRFPGVRKGSYSSTNFSRPRTLILIGCLALVYGEHLDLRIGHLFNNITESVDSTGRIRFDSIKATAEKFEVSREKLTRFLKLLTENNFTIKLDKGVYMVNPFIFIGKRIRSNADRETLQAEWNELRRME